MKLVWHIIKKDLRAVWPLALGWLALIAVRIPLLVYVAGSAEERLMRYLAAVSTFAVMGDVLMVLALVRSLVHEDALVGDKAFWTTRPITGGQLLAAKVASIVVICFACPLVLLVPTWLGFGFSGTEIWAAIYRQALITSGPVVAGLAFSVVTRKAGAFWLAMVATVVAVVMGAIITSSAEAFVIKDHLIKTRLSLATILGVALVLVGAVYQFKKRRATGAIGCYVLGGIAWIVVWFWWPLGIPFFEKGRAGDGMIVQPVSVAWVGNEIQLAATKKAGSFPSSMSAELKITVPKEYGRVGLIPTRAQWVLGNEKVDAAVGAHLEVTPLYSVYGTPTENLDGTYSCQVPLRFDTDWLWNKEQPWKPVDFEGQLKVDLQKTVVVVDLALSKNARMRQGSYSARILRVQPNGDSLSLSLVEAYFSTNEMEAPRLVDAKERPSVLNCSGRDYMNAWILGISIKYRRFVYNHPERHLGKSHTDFPAIDVTAENLAERGWRIVGKVNQRVGFVLYDLKATKLNIVKASAL